ncbi:MAG: hypothetical protein GX591_02350 [Planctomycetes bacterium]|nr:hypothetical protein [Planctomycetota bacterium]
MSTAATTKREQRRTRAREFFAKRSTDEQRALMKRGDPIEQMREGCRGRMVANASHHCFTCGRFLGHRGGCPGVFAPAREGPPMCHENVYTGQHAQPAEYVEGVGWRLKAGQERWYELDVVDAGKAIVGPRRR